MSTRGVGSSFRSTFLAFAPPSETSTLFRHPFEGAPAEVALESRGPFFQRALRQPFVGDCRFSRRSRGLPLLGFSKDAPLSTSRHASGPGSGLFRDPRLGDGDAAPSLLPLLPFFPASAVYSAYSLAGLLRPAADPGVQPVRETDRSRVLLPPSCLPFEALILFIQPYRVTAALVPSRRSCLIWSFDQAIHATSGSCSGEESSPSRKPCGLLLV